MVVMLAEIYINSAGYCMKTIAMPILTMTCQSPALMQGIQIKMLAELKGIFLNKKSTSTLTLFFIFIFSLGFIAGSSVPHSKLESVFKYAVALEKENSKVRKKLKSCN